MSVFLETEAAYQLENHQKQIDADGTMVGVSRQALDEVLVELKKLRKAVNKKSKKPSASALLFYSKYPRKQGGKKALVAFDAMTKANQRLALADDTAARYSDREKQYIPLPTSYLHGELWKDEIIKPEENHGAYKQGSRSVFEEGTKSAFSPDGEEKAP